jgi:uncharacterized NAD(P)/FAD-binding protein YdhS
MRHIGIIGGGFSGVATAANLARLGSGPLKITIINSAYPLARGIAYSTRNGNHLLNVAARNMSALADQPNHFVDWLRTRTEFVDEPFARLREMFVPRRIYGDYLHALLFAQTGAAAEKGITIESVSREATDIVPAAQGGCVTFSNGESLSVDMVVLATGNSSPSSLKIQGLDASHPKYFQNPWTGWEDKLTDRTENVILVGTGLTAVDAFITLKDLGWKGKIFAISRNGFLPLPHFKGTDVPDWLVVNSEQVPLSTAFGQFKASFRQARSQGINPAILVDKLRPVTQRLWKNLSLAEKQRFNRHLRTRWNVVRHRVARSIHQQLAEAMAAYRLEIVKGRICRVAEVGDQLVVRVKTGNNFRELEGGALINCTGPSETFSGTSSVLYRNLQARGLVTADEMDMGIQANADFGVINGKGEASRFLYVLGPALKGTLWETSAVPELRHQAFRLAEILAEHLFGKRVKHLTEAVEIVQEFEI